MNEKHQEFNQTMAHILAALRVLASDIKAFEGVPGISLKVVATADADGKFKSDVKMLKLTGEEKATIDVEEEMRKLFEANGRKFTVKEKENGKS